MAIFSAGTPLSINAPRGKELATTIRCACRCSLSSPADNPRSRGGKSSAHSGNWRRRLRGRVDLSRWIPDGRLHENEAASQCRRPFGQPPRCCVIPNHYITVGDLLVGNIALECRVSLEHHGLAVVPCTQPKQGTQLGERPGTEIFLGKPSRRRLLMRRWYRDGRHSINAPQLAVRDIAETRPKPAQASMPLKLPDKLKGMLGSGMYDQGFHR